MARCGCWSGTLPRGPAVDDDGCEEGSQTAAQLLRTSRVSLGFVWGQPESVSSGYGSWAASKYQVSSPTTSTYLRKILSL